MHPAVWATPIREAAWCPFRRRRRPTRSLLRVATEAANQAGSLVLSKLPSNRGRRGPPTLPSGFAPLSGPDQAKHAPPGHFAHHLHPVSSWVLARAVPHRLASRAYAARLLRRAARRRATGARHALSLERKLLPGFKFLLPVGRLGMASQEPDLRLALTGISWTGRFAATFLRGRRLVH